MTGSPRATVIVVNYNGAHLLPACLDALAAQATDGPAFDTVVVDNASVDGSCELLAAEYPWATLIANETNLGFAGGNNVALRQLRTPYAVLLNNDAVPEPGWLRELLGVFEQQGNHDVGIVTGKVLFLPKFVTLALDTPGFQPGTADTRDLGVRIYQVLVNGVDVTEKVLWKAAVYGPEGHGEGRFRWSRPNGEILVPVPAELCTDHQTDQPVTITLLAAAESAKPLTLASADQSVTGQVSDRTPTAVVIELHRGTAALDVVNNVGGRVFDDGSGGDRGFQEIDRGQYDEATEVFTACGNGMAMRSAVGNELGWFDDSFFMYYEDTDLSWRWRSAGWSIRYQPTAVLRHIHSASSKEWSPRWMFFVERNRLLMLTKNATPALALSAFGSYLRAFLVMSARSVRETAVRRRRPALGVHLLRLKVLMSFSKHVPHALRDRISMQRRAVTPARELQKWLVQR
ncbi:MAG: glycosyltransferase [Actinomycetota bacterium]|nr:glycosyltransferase [Actinomycetota bacterium]